MMKCEVCTIREATRKCRVCGRAVCDDDFDHERGMCSVCARAICAVCGKNLSIGLCKVCGRPVCEDCAVEVSQVEIVCRLCAGGGRSVGQEADSVG